MQGLLQPVADLDVAVLEGRIELQDLVSEFYHCGCGVLGLALLKVRLWDARSTEIVRRPYCSRAWWSSLSLWISPRKLTMVASRSASSVLRDLTSARRDDRLSSRYWLPALMIYANLSATCWSSRASTSRSLTRISSSLGWEVEPLQCWDLVLHDWSPMLGRDKEHQLETRAKNRVSGNYQNGQNNITNYTWLLILMSR